MSVRFIPVQSVGHCRKGQLCKDIIVVVIVVVVVIIIIIIIISSSYCNSSNCCINSINRNKNVSYSI